MNWNQTQGMEYSKTVTQILSLATVIILGLGCDISEREESLEFSESISSLVVNAQSGDVHVTAAETDVISVDLVIRGDDTVVDQSIRGEELLLETNCDKQLLNCSVSYTITVPPRMVVSLDSGSGDLSVVGTIGNAQLDTGSGNAEAHCIRGDEILLQSGSGDIFCSEVEADRLEADTGSGDVTLSQSIIDDLIAETSSGDIEGRSLEVARISADTGSGDVNVSSSTPPESLRADTGSGDINLQLPSDQYAVRTDTGSGDVDIDGIVMDSNSPRSINASTGSGDITIVGR